MFHFVENVFSVKNCSIVYSKRIIWESQKAQRVSFFDRKKQKCYWHFFAAFFLLSPLFSQPSGFSLPSVSYHRLICHAGYLCFTWAFTKDTETVSASNNPHLLLQQHCRQFVWSLFFLPYFKWITEEEMQKRGRNKQQCYEK